MAEWISKVQGRSPDEVLMACPMAPPRNEVGGRAFAMAGRLTGGLLGGLLAHKTEQSMNRGRAGGLPNTFVMAITPTKVRVFESKNTFKGVLTVSAGTHEYTDRFVAMLGAGAAA